MVPPPPAAPGTGRTVLYYRQTPGQRRRIPVYEPRQSLPEEQWYAEYFRLLEDYYDTTFDPEWANFYRKRFREADGKNMTQGERDALVVQLQKESAKTREELAAQLDEMEETIKWAVDGAPTLTEREKWVLSDLNAASVHYDGREMTAGELSAMLQALRGDQFTDYNRKENAQKMYPMGFGTLRKSRGGSLPNHFERIFSADVWGNAGKLFGRVILDPLGVLINLGSLVAASRDSWGANQAAVDNFFDYDLKDLGIDLAVEVGTLGAGTAISKSPRAMRAAQALAEMRASALGKLGAGIRGVSPKLARKMAEAIQYIKETHPSIYAKHIKGEADVAAGELVESLLSSEEKAAAREVEQLAADAVKAESGAVMNAVKDIEKQFGEEAFKQLGTESEQFAAFLSNHVYKDVEERAARLGSYKYVKDKSTAEIAVYVDEQSKRIFMSHRGTSNLKDVATDANIALGMEAFGPRMKSAEAALLDLHKLYPDHVISLTGHSLGGGVATHLMSEYGTREWIGHATTFNAATSPLQQTFKRLQALGKGEAQALGRKTTHIRFKNDVVSGWGYPFGDIKTYRGLDSAVALNPLAAHSMVSFRGSIGVAEASKSFTQWLVLAGYTAAMEGGKLSFKHLGQVAAKDYADVFREYEEAYAGVLGDIEDNEDVDDVDDVGDVVDSGGAIAAGGGTCDVVPVAAAPTYFIGSSPFQTHHERQLMEEEEASMRVNAAINFETVASGSLVSTTGLNGAPMVCKFSSPAECQTATHKDTGTCAPVPTVAEVVDGVVPPIEGAELGSGAEVVGGGEMTASVPQMRTGHATGPHSVIEKLKTMNAPAVGYVVYPTNQKTKFEYNFIVY